VTRESSDDPVNPQSGPCVIYCGGALLGDASVRRVTDNTDAVADPECLGDAWLDDGYRLAGLQLHCELDTRSRLRALNGASSRSTRNSTGHRSGRIGRFPTPDLGAENTAQDGARRHANASLPRLDLDRPHTHHFTEHNGLLLHCLAGGIGRPAIWLLRASGQEDETGCKERGDA
jgi:hypothetical protein